MLASRKHTRRLAGIDESDVGEVRCCGCDKAHDEKMCRGSSVQRIEKSVVNPWESESRPIVECHGGMRHARAYRFCMDCGDVDCGDGIFCVKHGC